MTPDPGQLARELARQRYADALAARDAAETVADEAFKTWRVSLDTMRQASEDVTVAKDAMIRELTGVDPQTGQDIKEITDAQIQDPQQATGISDGATPTG